MTKQLTERLMTAMHERRMVKLSRRFETTCPRGYILDVGPKFVVLSLVSDRLWFDGYECFRIADVKKLATDPYSKFAEAVLSARGEKRPKRSPVDVSTTENLITSSSKAFPLIAIHTEQVDPNVCWIGRVQSVRRGRISFLSIKSDATWEAKPDHYNLDDITRINFDGDYERALDLIGGDGRADKKN
jgi:hypothetical protein